MLDNPQTLKDIAKQECTDKGFYTLTKDEIEDIFDNVFTEIDNLNKKNN